VNQIGARHIGDIIKERSYRRAPSRFQQFGSVVRAIATGALDALALLGWLVTKPLIPNKRELQ